MYGEINGYAHYLQTAYFILKKVQFLWYDIICKYWPWLKNMTSSQLRTCSQLCLLRMQKRIHDLVKYSVPLTVLNFILAVNIKTYLFNAQIQIESSYPYNNEWRHCSRLKNVVFSSFLFVCLLFCLILIVAVYINNLLSLYVICVNMAMKEDLHCEEYWIMFNCSYKLNNYDYL